jgi:hypothetical protein
MRSDNEYKILVRGRTTVLLKGTTMGLMHRLQVLGSLVLAAGIVSGCQGSPDLEELPAGTNVTIETQDGRLVTGKLAAVEPETVLLTQQQGEGQIRVTRANIVEVQAPAEEADSPSVRQLTVPAGSTMTVSLETAIGSDTSQAEDAVRATLASPLVVDGITVAPRGSVLLGVVTGARESGRVRGRAEVGMRFDRLQTSAVTYDIRTRPLYYIAEATKGEDAAKIGIGAAAGAVIGGIAGGGQGAAVGSAIGAGGGTAVVLATRGEEIRVGSGTELRIALTEPLSVTVSAEE